MKVGVDRDELYPCYRLSKDLDEGYFYTFLDVDDSLYEEYKKASADFYTVLEKIHSLVLEKKK